jgi:hypothetical protein
LLPEARHVVTPSGIVASGFPAVRETCSSIGWGFDPWQRDLNTLVLAKGSDGLLAADTVAMSICRQAGKTYDIGGLVFADSIINPGTTSVWTAHRFKVARESFDALRAMAKSPLLAPHIDYDAITTAAGNETIPFRNGSRVVFAARERGTIRGFSKVRRLVLDEGQILSEAAMSDLAPTMNQAHDPQIIIMGTPPKPTDPSEFFSGLRASALEGSAEGVLFVEFGAEPGSDLDDRSAWARANPSYPSRTPEKAILRLRKLLSDDDFAREALGIWDTEARRGVIDPDVWFGLRDPQSQADTRSVVFAADVSPDRQTGSIALAGERPDGRVHVEVIVPEAGGTAWMDPWLVERAKRYRAAVVLDAGAPAGALIPELQKAGVEPLLMTTRDVGQACGMFFDGAVEDRLRHLDDPRLNTALAAGRKRDIGVNGLWAWHRRDTSTDLTPLVAATNAVWGFLARRPEPGRKRATGRSRSY